MRCKLHKRACLVDEMPEEFETYEDAAEFWDTHESTNYKHLLEEVKMEIDIRKRHYLVELNTEAAKVFCENAMKKGILDEQVC